MGSVRLGNIICKISSLNSENVMGAHVSLFRAKSRFSFFICVCVCVRVCVRVCVCVCARMRACGAFGACTARRALVFFSVWGGGSVPTISDF